MKIFNDNGKESVLDHTDHLTHLEDIVAGVDDLDDYAASELAVQIEAGEIEGRYIYEIDGDLVWDITEAMLKDLPSEEFTDFLHGRFMEDQLQQIIEAAQEAQKRMNSEREMLA